MTDGWAIPEVWERQPEEPVKAFAAFTSYRDMGMDRSFAKVARQFGRALSQISGWAGRFQWVARAQAWDAEMDRQKRNAMLGEIEKAGRRSVLAGQLLMSRGVSRIQKMTDEEINELTVWEATRLIEVGTRLERVGHGEPPEPLPAAQLNVIIAKEVGDITIMDYLHHHPGAVSGIIPGLAMIKEAAPDLGILEGTYEEVVEEADEELDDFDRKLDEDNGTDGPPSVV